jgi:hypothetical protein
MLYKTILESAGFHVSEPHDPTPEYSIYRGKKITTKCSRYTISLDGYSYDNMIVSDNTNERTLLRHFFMLFALKRKESARYKKLYEESQKEIERMREHATRILHPTTLDEPQNL